MTLVSGSLRSAASVEVHYQTFFGIVLDDYLIDSDQIRYNKLIRADTSKSHLQIAENRQKLKFLDIGGARISDPGYRVLELPQFTKVGLIQNLSDSCRKR